MTNQLDSSERPPRLWAQVWSPRPPEANGHRTAPAAAGGALFLSLAASTVGKAVDAITNYLTADDEYVVGTLVPISHLFYVTCPEPLATAFAPRRIIVNLGPHPVKIDDKGEIEPDIALARSPVAVAVEFFEPVGDPRASALGVRLAHWKYNRFVNPHHPWIHDPVRSASLDIEFLRPDRTSALRFSLEVSARASEISSIRPEGSEALPWLPRPTGSYPTTGGPASLNAPFDPANLKVTLREVAKPSLFGKQIGSALGANKTAIEEYVKKQLTGISDAGAQASARLAAVTSASAQFDKYQSAHKAAVDALAALEAGSGDQVKLRQAHELALAALRAQEALTRRAFDQASLPFHEMPEPTLAEAVEKTTA
jgi:hypothetical protein